MLNQIKSKLAAGQVVVGSFVYVPSAELTEIIGLLGFDFVVIDMEHGPIDTKVAGDMVRAAELAGVTPIIRVTHNAQPLILRALDIGALGVHVPNVNETHEAQAAVASVKYPPQGQRGLADVRAARYGLTRLAARIHRGRQPADDAHRTHRGCAGGRESGRSAGGERH